ncbi:conserved oligomeric Golgi complex subunit 7 isoform X1 [Lathyrus oleraceus]|uniref:Conserved oligomeric Golgi complex subunit 7 n=3 Tax=Pisum sativum TaxID=3888 RepID=A0A9D4VSZ6_PEA|nr:conserved oligomeric Golgi complex subunit 7 isoform X1 [Pisum sativum]KAI5389610.1 Golgi transport complex subunit 7 [Pisum sativum]
MMVDLGPFSNENFDPKKWINSACQSRHPQESLDKHLVDLEMKLQMVSEEIAASLEDQSTAALLRVPRATRDVIRLRDDAVSLRSAVSAILQKLKKAEGSSAESIAALAKVDVVKQRMDAAYETLQDAAGLTQLSSTVEDVFASGDLPRAAETLANMRHCLSAVGEVAEFANIRKQLEVLEDRLDTMVQPRLTDALSNRKVDAAQDLRGILIRIGRFKSLESQYSKVHLKPIKQLWEDFESRERANKSANEKNEMERTSSVGNFQSVSPTISFSNWLPSFYDELLLYLEQEWKWCMISFPEDYKTLVPRLLSETMMAIGASFISHINLAIGDAVPETKALAKGLSDILSGDMQKGIKLQTKHLEALIELHNITGSFARNIQHLFSGSDVQVLMDVLKAVYLPYESFKQRYGQMERAILSSEIAGIDLRGAVIRGVGAQGVELSETVRRMEESIPQVIILLEASAERCISFTGGSEADELILALDDVMLQYISTLQETLRSLRTVCGVDYGGNGTGKKDIEKKDASQNARRVDLVSNEEEWSMVQGALQILTVADSLTSRSSVFEASLRATLARLSTTLSFSALGSSLDQNQTINGNEDGEPSFGGRAALDMATLRLVNVPEKARKLFSLLNQSKDPRFHALPLASQRVAAFEDTVNELVYDVLISKVRQRLSDVSRLPIWSSVEEQSAFPLPTFSAYPQSYVTSVGEYLLTLPQQLEPLAEGISSSEANDEAQFFATEWMFKVAEGATALYIEQLRGIQYITDRGAQQLSVDIDYLSNVLSALSMPIPAVLATFQSCLSTSRDQLKDLLKTDSAIQLDLPTANLVCKMRRVNLDS